MKKIISSWLVICMLIAMLPVQVFANTGGTELQQVSENPGGACGDNLTWELDEDTMTLTISGTGVMWDFTSEEDANVIIYPWEDYVHDLQSVVVENNVTSIGKSAFYHACNLTSVTLNQGLTRIDDCAFLGCYLLKEITIPESVTYIGSEAFYDCVGLENIRIPAAVTHIGENAFEFCAKLSGIWVHENNANYSSDESGVLFNKDKTTLVKAPGGLTGPYEIPATVTAIDDFAFEECAVGSIVFPGSVPAVGGGMFLRCENLTKVTIGEGVTTLGLSAFSRCVNLTEVTLPKGIQTVGNSVFYACEKLSDVYYGGTEADWQSVSVGEDNECLTNAKFHFAEEETHEHSFGDWYESKAPTQTEQGEDRRDCTGCDDYETRPTDKLPEVSGKSVKEQLLQLVEAKDSMTLAQIRAAVQALDFEQLQKAMQEDEEVLDCLYELGGISKVTVTKAVSIGSSSFHGAWGLSLNNVQNDDPVRLDKPVSPVEVPDGYNSRTAIHFSVNLDALGNNRTLTVPVSIDLVLPDEIHANFQHIFRRDPVTGTVEEIPVTAHWSMVGWCLRFTVAAEGDYVMAAPENMVMTGKCGDNLTWRYDDTYTLTISGTGDMYDYDLDADRTPWYSVRENVRHIEIGENVTGIGAYAFYDCRFADKTVIPPSVKCIGEYAFYGMDEQVFYFEGDAPEIAETAFYYAEYSTIYYHANKQGWSEVISKAFVEADGLKWVSMKENSDSCGENLTWKFDATTGTLTISGTGSMTNTWWPYESNGDLPEFAPWQEHAADIKTVVINSGVTSIGHFAFFDCVNLTSVTIPEGVTFVGCAFIGCDSLKELHIPASVTDFRYPTNEGVCTGLEKIVVAEENKVYASDAAGMLYSKDRTTLIGCPTGFRGSCTIPGGVTAIGDWAFYECAGLTSVSIPATVKTIGTAAFNACEKLDNVVIPEGVTTIPLFAFFGCANLSEIIIPAGVKKLDSGAFAECDSLAAVYFKGNAPEIAYDCFQFTETTAYYPAGNATWTEAALEDYEGKITWTPFAPSGGVTVSDKCDTMTLTHKTDADVQNLRFAVWSDRDGQDDLYWYEAAGDASGNWTCTVDLTRHNTTGQYQIHAYTIVSGNYSKLAEYSATVAKQPPAPAVSNVTVSADFRTMTVTHKAAEGRENVLYAVWSDQGGQDDLRWYEAARDTSGTWAYTVDLANHNTTGRYQIHVYDLNGGIYTKLAEYTGNVSKLPPAPDNIVISADFKTMTVTHKADAKYTGVRYAVWSDEGGQDDLHWYEAARDASGTWAHTIDLAKHNTVGKYQIHVYDLNGGIYTKLAEYTANVEQLPPAPDNIVISADFKTMTVTHKADAKYRSVRYAVWSDENGQDDLFWYQAARDASGTWTYTIDLAKHNTVGNYQIHVYDLNGGIYTKLAEYTVNVEQLPPAPDNIKVSDDCRTMTVIHNADQEKGAVYFAVWSAANGQDDLTFYRAARDASGAWACTVDLTRHNAAGTYYIHVYNMDSYTTKLAEYTANVAQLPPSAPENILISDDCTTMIVTYESDRDHENVLCAIWSAEGGQDDLQWYAAGKNASGTWAFTVDLTSHNTAGMYYIHTYAWDAGVYTLLAEYTANVAHVAKSPIEVKASADGSSVTVAYSDKETHQTVHMAIWSEANGQDDLQWYVAEKAGGTWRCTVNPAVHGGSGKYNIHVYAISGSVYTKLAESTPEIH